MQRSRPRRRGSNESDGLDKDVPAIDSFELGECSPSLRKAGHSHEARERSMSVNQFLSEAHRRDEHLDEVTLKR